MSTAVATASPVVPADQVSSRAFTFTQNGTTLPVQTVAATVNVATIPCLPGDVITVVVADTNSIGTTVSAVASGTDPNPPPTAPPTAPTVVLTFTNP